MQSDLNVSSVKAGGGLCETGPRGDPAYTWGPYMRCAVETGEDIFVTCYSVTQNPLRLFSGWPTVGVLTRACV